MNIKTESLGAPKQDIFKSGKFRSIIIQAIVMILFVSFVLWVINNTATNMTANGIAHGFDFLWENSMFDIGYLPFIDHTPVDTYFHAFKGTSIESLALGCIAVGHWYHELVTNGEGVNSSRKGKINFLNGIVTFIPSIFPFLISEIVSSMVPYSEILPVSACCNIWFSDSYSRIE